MGGRQVPQFHAEVGGQGGGPGEDRNGAAGGRGAKLNQGRSTGDPELSAKDPAGITDPEEFEKALKRVFGRKR